MLIDFSDQFRRLDQANRRGVELGAGLQTWTSIGQPHFEAQISNDRLSWSLILVMKKEPPTDEWGMVFGEVVHNLRSLLDNLVVTIARQSGSPTDKEIKSLQFPIAASAEEWKSQSKRIALLPDQYKRAIESIQPFQRIQQEGSPDGDLLIMLRDLSNEDKHHLYLKPNFLYQEFQNSSTVEFESEEAAAKNVPPNVTIFPPKFYNGAVLLTQFTKTRIVKITGAGKVGLQVQVKLPNGKLIGLTECAGMLSYYTGVVLKYISSIAT